MQYSSLASSSSLPSRPQRQRYTYRLPDALDDLSTREPEGPPTA